MENWSFLPPELPPVLLPDTTAENWPVRRQHLVDTLLKQEYGVVPPLKTTVSARLCSEEPAFFAGAATWQQLQLTVTLAGDGVHTPQREYGSFTFPMQALLPNSAPMAGASGHPFFVLLNFHPGPAGKYLPAEELVERGFGVVTAFYEDVSPDRENGFADPLAHMLRAAAQDAGVPAGQLPGRIAVWAWAESRMLDWALTQPRLCAAQAAVAGHSRLGKTALVCSMLDDRFAAVFSNEAGCSGDALTRGKAGEHVADITRNFTHWFCENYRRYADNEAALPFDQHWLLAASAPRLVCVGSALNDMWSSPQSQYACCMAASPAWQLLGRRGFVHPQREAQPGDDFAAGEIGYHLRLGTHFFSRHDWNSYMNFLDGKRWHV